MPADYLTVDAFAKLHTVSVQRVKQWLAQSRIKGAYKHGRMWAIPSKAKRPSDMR